MPVPRRPLYLPYADLHIPAYGFAQAFKKSLSHDVPPDPERIQENALPESAQMRNIVQRIFLR
jgi:hypothetical protein